MLNHRLYSINDNKQQFNNLLKKKCTEFSADLRCRYLCGLNVEFIIVFLKNVKRTHL